MREPRAMPDVTDSRRTPLLNEHLRPRLIKRIRGWNIYRRSAETMGWTGFSLHQRHLRIHFRGWVYVIGHASLEEYGTVGRHIITLIWRPYVRKLTWGIGPKKPFREPPPIIV